MSGGIVQTKSAGIDAVTGCPVIETVPDGYVDAFRRDTNTGGLWLRDGQWDDISTLAYATTCVKQAAQPVYAINMMRKRKIRTSLKLRGSITITSPGGTAANAVTLGLPEAMLTAAVQSIPVGTCLLYDSSAGAFYKGQAMAKDANTLWFLSYHSTGAYLGTVDFTAALASGDIFTYDVEVETAA